MFAKVENGVTKLCANFFAGKTGKTQFWHEIFHFFEQDRVLFASRVDIGVTRFPRKTAEKEEEKNGA